MESKDLLAEIQKNWLWQKPLKFVHNVVSLGFLKNQAKKFDTIDIKDFCYWLYYFYGFKEPNGKSWEITWLLNNTVLAEYKKYIELKTKEQDLCECIDVFYKKYSVQKNYGLRGFNFVVEYMRPYCQKFGKEKVIETIVNSQDISGSIFKVFSKLQVDKKVEKGNWQQNEDKEKEKYYTALKNRDFNLALNDRGRKMLLTVEWGRKLMAQCYWCVEFLERSKYLFDSDIQSLIKEYDECITKQQRDKVIRKYEPEQFEESFDTEYDRRKKELIKLKENNIYLTE